MTDTENDVRLEREAMLATHHPDEDWIRNVAAKNVWGSRANKDLIGLVDECERVVTLWYHKDTLSVAKIDPDTISGKRGGTPSNSSRSRGRTSPRSSPSDATASTGYNPTGGDPPTRRRMS